ncbi:MAG: pilus assembly protein N-terminal domain-containing protein [Pirellulaceae bacterium]
MSISLLAARRAVLASLAAVACGLICSVRVGAQEEGQSAVKFQVRGPSERLEMTVNSSKVVEFPFDVPKMLVNNPDLVRVIPISPKSIQLSAVRAGITQLNVWDADDNVTTLDLVILGDVGELDMTLKSLFPEAALKLRPLNSSLYISGFVPKAEMVQSITNVARDYFPNIINDMTVGGVQKVLLHVKVMEVSRTKLRAMGFDWAQLSGGSFVTQSVSKLLETPGTLGNSLGIGSQVRFGVVSDGGSFFGFLEALRENNMAKLMAEPTLTTLSGRPATFNVGGEVPIPIQQSLGVTTVQWREFGTRIDFVPIVLGNGIVRLEVRPEVTEIDPSLRDSVTGTPGFRTRRVDTAVEMKAGQTLAIAGLVSSREEALNRGIPVLADLPWFGAPFRKVTNTRNEIELLIFVTPEFCEAMDPSEVPPCGPGQLTVSPNDAEFYGRGYLEVPKAGCVGGNCGPGGQEGLNFGPQGGQGYEEIPSQYDLKAPVPTARRSSGLVAPVVSAPASNYRTRTVGTGVSSSTKGGSVKLAQPGSTNRKPSSSAQPTLIGPLGYDDLR